MDSGIAESGTAISPGRTFRGGLRIAKRTMLHAWWRWRQLGWTEVDARDYARAFDALGGSVHVHPLVLEFMEQEAGRRVRYIARFRDGAPLAALPMVNGFIGATQPALAQWCLHDAVDIGDGELVLPVAPAAGVRLPAAASMISELHAADVHGLTRTPDVLQMLALGADERSSGGLFAVSRRKLRRFLESGGVMVDVRALAPADLARHYENLFRMRWGRLPVGAACLARLLGKLAPMLRGVALFEGENPVALQVVYAHRTPRGLLGTYVNGGLNPDYRPYSPGSILYYLNVESLSREAATAGVPLRFCFGRNDASYKEQWCRGVSIYATA